MRRGEVYLGSFPYGDMPAMKLRPVLLLTGQIGAGVEILVAYISSVVPVVPLESDLPLDPSRPEHSSTGLKSASVVRLHKLATIHVTSLRRRLGEISAEAQQDVDARLKDLLKL